MPKPVGTSMRCPGARVASLSMAARRSSPALPGVRYSGSGRPPPPGNLRIGTSIGFMGRARSEAEARTAGLETREPSDRRQTAALPDEQLPGESLDLLRGHCLDGAQDLVVARLPPEVDLLARQIGHP